MNQNKKVLFIQVDQDVALARYSEFTKTCHNMNIIVQITGGDSSSLNGKEKSQIIYLLISQEILYYNQVTRNNFVTLPISMTYGSTSELIIDCVVMFLTSYGMYQDLHTKS